MGNIFKYSAVAFAALIAAACQHELSDMSVAGEETIVKFTVNAPAGLQTKADEVPVSKVNRLYVEVYTDEACTQLYSSEVVEGEKTGWDLKMSVLKGHTYHMLLVAGCDGYFEKADAGNGFNTGIKMNYSAKEGSENNGNGNMEEHDLFVAKTSFTSETAGGTITLTRPLAQINIYANDLKNKALDGKITLKKQSVTISNIADVHYPVTGTSSETGYEATFMTTDSYTEDGRVLMCYVLPVNDGKERLVDISVALDFDYDGLTGQHLDYDIPNVPIQKNHRTNIYGNLYCEQAEFTFTLDTFEGVKDVELWDGTSSDEPRLIDSDDDGDEDTYLLSTAEHLAWIRNFVNGNLQQTRAEVDNSLADFTIKLEQDIDLSGKEWEPIGYGKEQNDSFNGTFDGNGHIIRNFKITGRHNNSPQAALFGTVRGATIKNLTIENASVTYTPDDDDFYAAGVAGTVYGATFDNIVVRNSSFEGNNKVAGIFAHEDAGTLVEVKNCHVINCTLRSIDSKDGGNVGGIAGVMTGGGEHRFSDSSVENCTIFGYNPENTGKRSNGEFVANIIGSDKFEIYIDNCKIIGNTFEQAENVTYVSPFGEFVGGSRDDEYKGRVIVDGVEYVYKSPLHIQIEEGIQATQAGGTYTFPESTTKQTELSGVSINIDKEITIDLGGETVANPVIGGGAIVLKSGAKLTLKNGTLNNGSIETAQGAHVIVVEEGAELTIDGGDYGTDEKGGNAIRNLGGKVTVNNGTFASCDRAVDTGRWAYVFVCSGATAELIINQATVNCNPNGMFSAEKGAKITVNGGSYQMEGNGVTYNMIYIPDSDSTVELLGGYYHWQAGETLAPVNSKGTVVLSENITREGHDNWVQYSTK